jgi:predicted RNase H-like HicB family nuclease
MMVKLTATVERASDGTFTAVAVIGEHTIIGDGNTKEAAIADLREGAEGLFEYLKQEGKPLPQLVSIEVEA